MRHRLWLPMSLVLLLLASTACSITAGAGRDSPMEGRIDFRLAPRLTFGSSETVEVRPTAAYEFAFSGANAFNFGAQFRFVPEALPDRRWFGGEGLYVVRFAGGGTVQSARFGGLFGVPIRLSKSIADRATTHLVGAAGISQQRGGTGFYFRMGLEFNPKKK